MAFDKQLYKEALEKVLHNFGKAGWIESADIGDNLMRVRFKRGVERKMLLISELMKEVKWPTDKYQILAFINLAKMLTDKYERDE